MCVCVCIRPSFFSLFYFHQSKPVSRSLTAAPHIPQTPRHPPPSPTPRPSQASQHPARWNYSVCGGIVGNASPPLSRSIRPSSCSLSFSHSTSWQFFCFVLFLWRGGAFRQGLISMFTKWAGCRCHFPISKLWQDADLRLCSFLLAVNFPPMQRTRNLYFAVVEVMSGRHEFVQNLRNEQRWDWFL